MPRLNADISVMFLIATSRVFYSRGSFTEKALSPNYVLVQGMSNLLMFADGSRPRPGIVKILVVLFAI